MGVEMSNAPEGSPFVARGGNPEKCISENVFRPGGAAVTLVGSKAVHYEYPSGAKNYVGH